MSGQIVKTPVAEGRLTWTTRLDKGGWRIFVRRKSPVGQVQVSVKSQGAHVQVTARVLAQDNTPAANVPLEVRIYDTTGKPAPYGSCPATDIRGNASAEFDAGSLTDKPGAWRVEVTELLSGKQGKANLPLTFK